MQPPLRERFWAKVDKGKLDECWEWQGAISQMAASDREIRIVTDIDGAVIRTYEVKSVGKKKIA